MSKATDVETPVIKSDDYPLYYSKAQPIEEPGWSWCWTGWSSRPTVTLWWDGELPYSTFQDPKDDIDPCDLTADGLAIEFNLESTVPSSALKSCPGQLSTELRRLAHLLPEELEDDFRETAKTVSDHLTRQTTMHGEDFWPYLDRLARRSSTRPVST